MRFTGSPISVGIDASERLVRGSSSSTRASPRFTMRAGVPTAVQSGGTSCMRTKEFAPTRLFGPTVIGPSSVA